MAVIDLDVHRPNREGLEKKFLEKIHPSRSLEEIYTDAGDLALSLTTITGIQKFERSNPYYLRPMYMVLTSETEEAVSEWASRTPDGFRASNRVAVKDFSYQLGQFLRENPDRTYAFDALGMAVRTLDLVRSLPEEIFAPQHQLIAETAQAKALAS